MTNKITIYPADPLDMHALGVRRFPEYEFEADTLGAVTISGTEPQPYQLNVLSGHYGARAAGVEGALYDRKAAQRITEEGRRQMRDYLKLDIEYTQSARKFFETEQAIAEALEMRRRGRPAPLPRPTLISLHIFHIIETWSQYK